MLLSVPHLAAAVAAEAKGRHHPLSAPIHKLAARACEPGAQAQVGGKARLLRGRRTDAGLQHPPGPTLLAPLAFLALLAACAPSPQRETPTAGRIDDAKLRFPPLWQACTNDRQCVRIGYGCSGVTAVAAAHETAARAQAWKLAGDPRVLDCTPSKTAPHMPRCVASKCGMFSPPP